MSENFDASWDSRTQWKVLLHLVSADDGQHYQLTQVELKPGDGAPVNDFASREIKDCAYIPASAAPDPEHCLEVWAYAPCVSFDSDTAAKFVTLNETISFGYPSAPEWQQPLQGEAKVVALTIFIYESGAQSYNTLVLAEANYDSEHEPDIQDCQDIPAGDPVKCVQIWMTTPTQANQPATDDRPEPIFISLGGISIRYPRRRR